MVKKILLGSVCFLAAACVSVEPSQEKTVVSEPAPEAANGAIRAVPMPSAPLDMSKSLTRIVFASCAQQLEDQAIWDQIVADNPDLTLYIGDNVYGDVYSRDPALPELKAAYMRLAQSTPFARARAAAPMLTVWDDHDYGMNDAGGEYQYKESAEELFEYVWALDANDPRRARPGVYSAWTIGAEGERVQVIMLDTRFFRSELKETDERGAPGKERYLPDPDPSKTMLGEDQWRWLEEELKKPADLRLLVSSVQVISEGHGWEAWKMLPTERDRLYALIDESDAENLILISGDRHAAALYRKNGVNDYPLFEATSSSLNLPGSAWRPTGEDAYVEPGPNRLGDFYYDENYGVIEIDWAAGAIAVSIRSKTGETVLAEEIELSTLR